MPRGSEPRPSDVEINVDGEGDGGDAGHGREGPEEAAFLRGQGEGRDDDGGLGGEHADEKLAAAAVVAFGREVGLADLELVEVGDDLVELRLHIVAGTIEPHAGGGEVLRGGAIARSQFALHPVELGVGGCGGGVESDGDVLGGAEGRGQVGIRDEFEQLGNLLLGLLFFHQSMVFIKPSSNPTNFS